MRSLIVLTKQGKVLSAAKFIREKRNQTLTHTPRITQKTFYEDDIFGALGRNIDIAIMLRVTIMSVELGVVKTFLKKL